MYFIQYKIAEKTADTNKTPIDNIKAKIYVIGAYPIPVGLGSLNINIIEIKNDSIANNIGIAKCNTIVFLFIRVHSPLKFSCTHYIIRQSKSQ